MEGPRARHTLRVRGALRRARRTQARSAPLGLTALRGLTGLAVVVYALSTELRPKVGWGWLFDGVIGNVGYAGCAALCAWRAVANRHHRWAWAAIAASLALFTTGAVLWTTVVQYWDPVPYPSVADAFFLVFYPAAYLGVGLLARDVGHRRSSQVWLEGLIAALGVAALETVFVFSWIARSNTGNTAAVVTNIAYPVGDIVLVMMVVTAFAVRGWRPQGWWWLLGGGLVIFAVADTVYVLRVLSGTYVTGTPLDSLWLIGTFLVAGAAWRDRGAEAPTGRANQPVIVPVLFTLTSLGIVVVDGVALHAPEISVALATATVVLAVVRLTRSYRQLQQLAESRRLAVTDDLTGLGNRRLLRCALDRVLVERGATAAVLVVDLDRFKEVNDAFGHPAGDELLTAVGARLRRIVRPDDTLVRLGGDEFALLLGGAGRARAIEVADRIDVALRPRFDVAHAAVHITASIGVALAPDDATTTSELLRCADVALYRAKTARAPHFLYTRDCDRSLERLGLLEDLRAAIRHRELHLCFQPEVDLRTGHVRGVEALARWQHPTRGLVPPDEFIPLAEDAQLMGPLTDLVLELALTQCAAWRSSGVPMTIAVNLSTTNLLDESLPGQIQERLSRHGLPASALTLEITETTLMVDPDRARTVIANLHDLGVRISLDDFGTGFSSLAYLRDLAVDELKIDRTFLAEIAAEPEGRAAAIVRSTLQLGHALGVHVLAEGIEDEPTLALLTQWGCDAGQGYHLGRPVPAEELHVARVHEAVPLPRRPRVPTTTPDAADPVFA